jgi:hypothetical protein
MDLTRMGDRSNAYRMLGKYIERMIEGRPHLQKAKLQHHAENYDHRSYEARFPSYGLLKNK